MRGDPSAGFLLIVEFGPSAVPVSAARWEEAAEAGAQELAARKRWAIARFWYWLVEPLSTSAEKRPTWQGLTARLVIVLGFASAGWIIVTNLVPIAVGLFGLLCVVLSLALVGGASQSPKRKRGAPRRRR